MKKKVLTIVVILVILSSILVIISSINKKEKISKDNERIEAIQVEPTNTPLPTNTPEITQKITPNIFSFANIIGWIPTFDYTRAKQSFYNNINKFTEISPVFYDLKNDGSILQRSEAGDRDLIALSHKHNIKVIPTIISTDISSSTTLLNDLSLIKNHNTYIISEIETKNYDGIDLDYESLNIKNRDNYLFMINDLYSKLHNIGKKLSLSVLPKISEINNNETSEVQNWKSLYNSTDELRVMAYDYSQNYEIGPVSPFNWVKDIVKYSIDSGVNNKIIIGQPFYAYAYGKSKYAYTYSEIEDILKTDSNAPSLNPITLEKTVQFKKGEENRTLYFEDSETMGKRFSNLANAKISGLAFWRLGGEDSTIYNLLENKN